MRLIVTETAFAEPSIDVDGRPVWVATDPNRPGIYAMGDSADDAFADMVKAREFWDRNNMPRGPKTWTA